MVKISLSGSGRYDSDFGNGAGVQLVPFPGTSMNMNDIASSIGIHLLCAIGLKNQAGPSLRVCSGVLSGTSTNINDIASSIGIHSYSGITLMN